VKPTVKPTVKPGSYHHGDLRNTLILAAVALIEDSGSYEFSMAEAARKAGVSSAAPYRHFKDKDALLESVAELAFLALTEETKKVVAIHHPGSQEAIVALGKNYIRFVCERPEFYDLMWGDHGKLAMSEQTELRTPGFFIMVDMVQQWCDAQGLRNINAMELTVKIWAMAHGLAGLTMNHSIERFIPEVDVYALFEGSAQTFLEGLFKESDGPA
jgi:AcrR family transcriptional regulator